VSRGRCKFKQSDVVRAIKAVAAAGAKVSRVEIDPEGKIVVVTADGATHADDDADEVRRWLKEHD
jgi:hypothetical protein